MGVVMVPMPILQNTASATSTQVHEIPLVVQCALIALGIMAFVAMMLLLIHVTIDMACDLKKRWFK